MLLNVNDAEGQPQVIIVQGQATPADVSGTIAQTGQSQPFLAANAARAGFFFQNISTHNMTLNEISGDATDDGSIVVPAGGTFPPPGYPVPIGAVGVAGTAADKFVGREW